MMQSGLFGSLERVIEHGSERCVWIGSIDEVVVDSPAVHVADDCGEPGDVEVGKVAGVRSTGELVIEPGRALLHHEGEVMFAFAVVVITELSAHDFDCSRAKRLRHLIPLERIGCGGA